MKSAVLTGLTFWGVSASPAFAGIPIPLPLAGATGPVGLILVAGGYIGYRLYTAKK